MECSHLLKTGGRTGFALLLHLNQKSVDVIIALALKVAGAVFDLSLPGVLIEYEMGSTDLVNRQRAYLFST